MASENETVAMVLLNFEYLITLGNIGPTVATDIKRRLEDAHQREVSKLKRQVKIASDFYLWVVENAENELLQTIRDKAIEAEFKMNHPELDGIDFNEEDAK